MLLWCTATCQLHVLGKGRVDLSLAGLQVPLGGGQIGEHDVPVEVVNQLEARLTWQLVWRHKEVGADLLGMSPMQA